jgi:hypothetical protein
MRSFWSLLGEVYLQKISQRPSVVGKWTPSIWMAESCSKTDRGVSPGALSCSLRRKVALETKGQKRNKNMGFDSLLQLVKDRPHSEISFEIFECFLDLAQQDIELPESSGIFAAEVGAKQIAAFALTNLAQFVLRLPV